MDMKRIAPEKEKLLNPVVGRFNMTSQNMVGTVTELILKKDFKNIQEWEEFYYISGKERQDKEKKVKIGPDLTKLKREYGRTEEELEEIGKKLYEKVREFNKISEEDCINCIKQYVIDNTWEGIMEREKNTMKKLENEHLIKGFQKTSGDVDAYYSVDFEIIINNKKIGLQIKPPSYMGHDKADIREQNEQKQKKYAGKVFTVLSDKDGTILNPEIVLRIKEEIKRLS